MCNAFSGSCCQATFVQSCGSLVAIFFVKQISAYNPNKFPHLFEDTFRKLNNKSLFKAREVARSWQYFSNERNYPWGHVIVANMIIDNSATLSIDQEQRQKMVADRANIIMNIT